MAMKYKLLFIEILIGAMLGVACGVVFADTPMANLRLSTDMNGGGHSITNLDTISVSNAPWATPSVVTNIVTAIGGVVEEDPIALPIAYTAITNAAVAQATADTAWQNPASAADWTWTSDGTNITLTSYSTNAPLAVVIPDMLDGLPVTTIGANCFYPAGCGGMAITSVNGSGISSIGEAVFYDNQQLTSVSLPAATSIGEVAFNYCDALTSISLPAATSIGNAAFYNCTALTSVSFAQNAPAEGTYVYTDSPNVTNYVTNPTATGWGETWNGRPVVRLPVYADEVYLAGDALSATLAAKASTASVAIALTNDQAFATAAVSDHNLATGRHTTQFAAKANTETIVASTTVTTASPGNRYHWESATNVTLSINIGPGQFVNLATLRNTSTNTIAAIQPTGWKRFGTSITNSIPAGKAMTFGWDVSTLGAETNAYATAAYPATNPANYLDEAWAATGTVAVATTATTVTGVQSNAILTAQATADAAYPATNPSNYVDRAGATNGMQVAGAYLTEEVDPYSMLTNGTRAMSANLPMGGHSVTGLLNIAMAGCWQSMSGGGSSTIDTGTSGASQAGYNIGTQSIGHYAFGASQRGYNSGTQSIEQYAYGASQIGNNNGTQSIGQYAFGASQIGDVTVPSATATNNGVGAIQLMRLTSNQHALTTSGGQASILLGAGTVSNKNSFVAGDGNVSHGDGSVTATSLWIVGDSVSTLLAAKADYSSVTGIVNSAISDATWTPYTVTHSATNTIDAENGNLQSLNAGTSASVITFAAGSAGTVSTVRLEFFGSGSTTFVTNMLSGTDGFTLSTNSWNTLIFDSGYGVTNWYGTQLTR